MKKYQPEKLEKKWQALWKSRGVFKTQEAKGRPKYYILDMFPYISGLGLHVGHLRGYTATDVVARLKMMLGFNVLHPMGWDAFGLPAENYAIKTKTHPAAVAKKNIAIFKKQLVKHGLTYDWSREVNTTDPQYYKWTQWIFLQMFKKGLAFESYEPINWCPSCQTGLANEDLENGKCERCGSEIERKPMRQWVLRITDYAERLLKDLDLLKHWPEAIREMQKNWIGRSEGAEVEFSVIPTEAKGRAEESLNVGKRDSSTSSRLHRDSARNDIGSRVLKVFTTRPDTLFGATYCVIAPEHKLISERQVALTNWQEVNKYVAQARHKSDLERTDLAKEKTGVELKGVKAVNPVNGEELPIFVADYVLTNYGTGAIMAVPAHDERDWEFAKKYDLPIKQVVAPLFIGDGLDKAADGKSVVRRDTVNIFLKHWKEDKYLCLDWKDFGWHTGIIGGIEPGEDLIAAAKREIEEETGYKNLEFIRYLGGETHSHFFARHKDENRHAVGHGLLFELINDEWKKPDEKETKNHKAIWIDNSQMKDFLNLGDFKYRWEVLSTDNECFSGDGVATNSSFLNDLPTAEAKDKMISWLKEKKVGRNHIQYKLRDWVFSRQRYWGEPIPLAHCEKCGVVPVAEKDLPVKLPNVKHYAPSGTGESPLAGIEKWVKTKCPHCHGPAKRETNTMPQWAGSSWYYLRYIDPKNKKALVDKKKEKYWSPVDFYVGGAEHATRHLIYARFWHKFLFDINAVSHKEPFERLQSVGLILAEDGRKMSKRWNNVVNPDEVIKNQGADAMRLYEMFMGPFDQPCAWSTQGVVGMRRFLERVWALREKVTSDVIASSPRRTKQSREENKKLLVLLNQTIKKVTADIEEMRFNTAISALMILTNALGEEKEIAQEHFEKLVLLLAPFVPHLAEELWNDLGHKKILAREAWPKFDEKLIQAAEVTLVVQVNGKVRDSLAVAADLGEAEARELVLKRETVARWLAGQEPQKIIYIKGRLINIVV